MHALNTNIWCVDNIQQTPQSCGYVILVSRKTRSTARPCWRQWVVARRLWGNGALFFTAGHVPCILFWPRSIESPMYLTHWGRVKHIYTYTYTYTHIYIYSYTYIHVYIYMKWIMPSLAQTVTCRLFATESPSGPMLNSYRFPVGYILMEFSFNQLCEKMIFKLMSGKYQPHYFGSNVLWSQLCIFKDSRRNGIHSVPVE